MTEPVRPGGPLRKVDCVQIPVPDLDAGLAFYRDRLGHELLWRNHTAAGLRLPGSDTELVLHSERPDPEVDFLVDSVDQAVPELVRAGGTVLVEPFDIPVGRVAVVADPFGNRLTVLDLTRGRYVTDAAGQVTGVAGRSDGELLARAETRRRAAWRVLERLDLLRRWARHGDPAVVGSVALGVVVRPDIDVAIVTDAPRVEDGFAVVAECAAIPGVLRGRFRADLPPGDPAFPSGLYWKLDYRADDGVVWTIDMWLLERGAHGAIDTTTRLGQLLTDDRRARVLAIKEAAAAQNRRVAGFAVCQAVVAGEVSSLEEFDRWVASRGAGSAPRSARDVWPSSPQ